MSKIRGLLDGMVTSVGTVVSDWAGRPASGLAAFMDGIDDVWLVDAFLDQPDGAEAAGA